MSMTVRARKKKKEINKKKVGTSRWTITPPSAHPHVDRGARSKSILFIERRHKWIPYGNGLRFAYFSRRQPKSGGWSSSIGLESSFLWMLPMIRRRIWFPPAFLPSFTGFAVSVDLIDWVDWVYRDSIVTERFLIHWILFSGIDYVPTTTTTTTTTTTKKKIVLAMQSTSEILIGRPSCTCAFP